MPTKWRTRPTNLFGLALLVYSYKPTGFPTSVCAKVVDKDICEGLNVSNGNISTGWFGYASGRCIFHIQVQSLLPSSDRYVNQHGPLVFQIDVLELVLEEGSQSSRVGRQKHRQFEP